MGRSKNQKPPIASTASQIDAKEEESGIERSKYVFEQVNGWIENADNKVSVSCGVFTGVFGVITFLAEKLVNVPDNATIYESWHCVYRISMVLSLLIIACAVYFYAKAIIPNLKSSGNIEATKKKYPVYFGDIHSYNLDDYRILMERGTDRDFINELIQESWYNSGICLKKMKYYRVGVIFSIIAIVLAFVSFGAHCFMYM